MPELKYLETALRYLKDSSIDKQELIKILSKLNLHLSEFIYTNLETIEERLCKIELAKVIKCKLSQDPGYFDSNKTADKAMLEQFVKLIFKHTSTITDFQRELLGHLQLVFSRQILDNRVEIEKEGLIYDSDGKVIGTADLVINIFDEQKKLVKQYPIECDGAAHTHKDDTKRNNLLKQHFETSHLIVKHSTQGFEDYIKTTESALEIKDFCKLIKENEQHHFLKSPQQEATSASSSTQEHPVKILPEHSEELEHSKEPKTQKNSKKSKQAKSKQTASKVNDEFNSAINDYNNKILASRDLIESFNGSNFNGIIKSFAKQKHVKSSLHDYLQDALLLVLESDAKLALDFLQQIILYNKENVTQQFEIANFKKIIDDILLLLRKGIYHPVFKDLFAMLREDKKARSPLNILCKTLQRSIIAKSFNDDRPDILCYFLPQELDKKNILHLAIITNKKCIVKYFLEECQMDIKDVLYINNNLLHICAHSCKEITKLLIQHGDDVNYKDPQNNFSLLMFFVLKGDIEIVKLLLENGADVNYKNRYGNSSLRLACSDIKYDIEMIKLLIDYGADVNHKNLIGLTILEGAFFMKNNLESMTLLLEHGADVHCGKKEQADNILLMIALSEGNMEIAQLLLKNGANLNYATLRAFINKLEHGDAPCEEKQANNSSLMTALGQVDMEMEVDMAIAKLLSNNGANLNDATPGALIHKPECNNEKKGTMRCGIQ